jgi:hypothetical protein
MKTQKNGLERTQKRWNWLHGLSLVIIAIFFQLITGCQKEDIQPQVKKTIQTPKDTMATSAIRTTKVSSAAAIAVNDFGEQVGLQLCLSRVNSCILKKVTITVVCKQGNGLQIPCAGYGDIIIPGTGWDVPAYSNPQETPTEIFVDSFKAYDLEQYVSANAIITINIGASFQSQALAAGTALLCAVFEYQEVTN